MHRWSGWLLLWGPHTTLLWGNWSNLTPTTWFWWWLLITVPPHITHPSPYLSHKCEHLSQDFLTKVYRNEAFPLREARATSALWAKQAWENEVSIQRDIRMSRREMWVLMPPNPQALWFLFPGSFIMWANIVAILSTLVQVRFCHLQSRVPTTVKGRRTHDPFIILVRKAAPPSSWWEFLNPLTYITPCTDLEDIRHNGKLYISNCYEPKAVEI